MKNDKTATQRYSELEKEVKANMEAFQNKLAAHAAEFAKNPKNWGYVGDMAHFNDLLKQLLNKEE